MNENNMKKIINQDSIMIIGIILMLIVLISMGSFAFITWRSKSGNGELVTKIGDIAIVRFDNGINLNSDTLNPVLNYEDGIKASFDLTKTIDNSIYVKLYFIINKLPEQLKNENLKFKLFVSDNKESGFSFLSEGDFSDIKDNKLLLIDNYEIGILQRYFNLYVYIDGSINNSYNDNSKIDLTLGVEANSEINNITKEITSETENVTSEVTGYIEEE